LNSNKLFQNLVYVLKRDIKQAEMIVCLSIIKEKNKQGVAI